MLLGALSEQEPEELVEALWVLMVAVGATVVGLGEEEGEVLGEGLVLGEVEAGVPGVVGTSSCAHSAGQGTVA